MARVFITGSTDGLGRAAAASLIAAGHKVVLHARSPERAAEAADIGRGALAVVTGDLASAAQTRAVAAQVNALGRMDAVIHNAGVYTVPERGSTQEGHAILLAVNNLAPYILTALIERPPQQLIASGLEIGEAEEVAEAFGRHGLRLADRRDGDGWTAILLVA